MAFAIKTALLALLLHVTYAAATVTSAAAPLITPAPVAAPTHKLQARCSDGSCTGAYETTLSAATVTTTIESVTSVPCYTTTTVTDSTTIVSTVYSTEIITSTITEDNTVSIIHYNPTPVIESSVFETVIPITETETTYWETTSGGAWSTTITGSASWESGGASSAWGSGSASDSSTPCDTSTAESSQQSDGDAWTHMNDDDVAAPTVTGGWADSGSGESSSGGTVNWSGASKEPSEIEFMAIVCGAVGIVIVGELYHWFG